MGIMLRGGGDVISSGRSTFPISVMETPSGVTAAGATSRPRTPAAPASAAGETFRAPDPLDLAARVGSSRHRPGLPVENSEPVPCLIRSSAPTAPVTAGIPDEWARVIAAWEVLVPSSLHQVRPRDPGPAGPSGRARAWPRR